MDRKRGVLGAAAVVSATVLLAAIWQRRRKAKKFAASNKLVSSRGERLNLPGLPYISGVIEGFTDPYDAANNPNGVVLMAVAENKLTWDLLKPKVEAGLANLPQWAASYGPMQGQPMLTEPLAAFLAKFVFGGVPPSPSELVVGTGLSAILSNVFYSLCEPGDAVLIPAPYYSAFDNDLRAFGEVVRVPVVLDPSNGWALTPQALDAAAAQAVARTGRPPRALLLTNPHNPLGRCAPLTELQRVLAWCDAQPRGFHLVSDEIYALSVFGPNGAAHVSVASLGPGPAAAFGASSPSSSSSSSSGQARASSGGAPPPQALGPYRHVLWGLSKDWGASGFRVGVCWTQNQPLYDALCNAAVFTSVPGPVQAMTAHLLSDHAWCAAYLAENNARLACSADLCAAKLRAMQVPCLTPDAGMFTWVDLRAWLPRVAARHRLAWTSTTPTSSSGGGSGTSATAAEGWAAEAALYDDLRQVCKVVLTPGAAQHAPDPGWFRICFAFVDPFALAHALDKVAAYSRDTLGHL